MELTGTHRIAATPPQVWAAITDPDMLRRCVPGAETVEREGDDAYAVIMVAAVGPLRARFKGRLQLQDVRAPDACVMVFEGEAGGTGFGRGRASVQLSPDAEATALRWSAQAEVGGKLAQVGSRLIDGVARKLSQDFFNALQRELGAAAPPADAGPARRQVDAPPAPAISGAGATRPSRAHGARRVAVGWLLAAVLAGALLGWLAGTYLH